jgi:type II secretory ATPase GspE/PulE/Tfp pilus assembly ATPase PilB-like protein
MILVTGPTGSGKTTTLYAVLQRILQNGSPKVLTVEDPVEYQVDGVSQVQVHAEIGLTFAAGLRAFLRHDPDVIMVGEIRDLETAEIAVRAALTGPSRTLDRAHQRRRFDTDPVHRYGHPVPTS